jgi:hypothetical protein
MLDRINPIATRTTKLSINKFQAFSMLFPTPESLTIISENIKYRGATKKDESMETIKIIKGKSENCGSFLMKRIKNKPKHRITKRPKKRKNKKVEARTRQKNFLIA